MSNTLDYILGTLSDHRELFRQQYKINRSANKMSVLLMVASVVTMHVLWIQDKQIKQLKADLEELKSQKEE